MIPFSNTCPCRYPCRGSSATCSIRGCVFRRAKPKPGPTSRDESRCFQHPNFSRRQRIRNAYETHTKYVYVPLLSQGIQGIQGAVSKSVVFPAPEPPMIASTLGHRSDEHRSTVVTRCDEPHASPLRTCAVMFFSNSCSD